MFQKGRQKTGGRKKGQKAKAKSLRQSLNAQGFNLASELTALLKDCIPRVEIDADGDKTYYHGNPKLRFDVLKLIAKYTQPPAPREEEDLDDDDDDEDAQDIIAALRASLTDDDAINPKAEETGMEGGGSALEAAQGSAQDLQADPKATERPT